MACVLLRGPSGERWVAENESFRYLAGEAIVPGEIRWKCGPQDARRGDDITDELAKSGIAWGDAVAWVTKRAGIKQCSGCHARQEILNSVSKLGLAETVRQIAGTF